MHPTLRRKLTTSFLLISLLSFLLIGALANVILEKQFRKYVIDNLEQKKEAIVSMLESQYNKASETWEPSSIENLGVNSLGEGLMLRVSDSSGNILWDAMGHNEGFCADMLHKMAENMDRQYGRFNGEYEETVYPLFIDGKSVGTAYIGFYGPYFYSDSDLVFLNTLNKLLLLAAGITALISVFIGTYMAKRMAGPISRVIKQAEQISEGNYSGRINEKANTREIIDLTESINTLAESLSKLESLRKRLTADVAHELRTPIANLQSHLEAMIDGVWEADTDRLKSCHEETVRLTKIVKDLESLARYESEVLQLELENIDVSDCMASVLKSSESEFKRKGISLVSDLTEVRVQADKDKLAQVFTNLISNALKFTPSGGRIEVSVSQDNSGARISIKDNGIGISADDLPYIFERFYRADKSRCRDTGGAGIGLAIVKSLVEAHRGTVEVKSESGEGSEFIVNLP